MMQLTFKDQPHTATLLVLELCKSVTGYYCHWSDLFEQTYNGVLQHTDD